MKRHLLTAAALLCAATFTATAPAQMTPVTATRLEMGGVAIPAGFASFQFVNGAGMTAMALPTYTSDGELNSPDPFITPIVNGAISGFSVPDQCLTVSAINATTPLFYQVRVQRTAASGVPGNAYTMVLPPGTVCGSTAFALDHPSGNSVSLPVTATPTASPVSGTVLTGSQAVAFADATTAALMYYTSSTSGTPADPTTSSPIYSAPITPTVSTTYKVLACAAGHTCAPVTAFSYTITQASVVSPSVMTAGVNGAFNGFKPFPGAPFYNDETATATSQYDSNFHAANVAGIHVDATIPYSIFNVAQYPLSLPTHADFDSISDTSNFTYPMGQVVETDDVLWPNLDGCNAEEGGTDPRTNWVSSSNPGDHHLLCMARDTNGLWESYQGRTRSGVFRAYNTMLFDPTQPFDGQVPVGTTSVDVAGLPILPLLYRYDEIVAGAINHAGRMTLPSTSCLFSSNGDVQGAIAAPAGHNGGATGCSYPLASWMGMKLLLRPDFDVSSYSATNQIILAAWKKYGVYVADNGARGYVQFTADSRWNGDDLTNLYNVKLADFKVLDTPIFSAHTNENTNYADSVIMTDANTTVPNPYGRPTINSFTASATTITPGQSVVFTGNVTGGVKVYVENGGVLVNGQVTVTPVQTTQYRLIAKNKFGMVQTAYQTITVNGPTAAPATTNVPAGTAYTTAQDVTFASTSTGSGGVIHVQSDGTEATCNSAVNASPYHITSNTYFSTIVCGTGLVPSAVTDYSYPVNIPVTATPSPTTLPTTNLLLRLEPPAAGNFTTWPAGAGTSITTAMSQTMTSAFDSTLPVAGNSVHFAGTITGTLSSTIPAGPVTIYAVYKLSSTTSEVDLIGGGGDALIYAPTVGSSPQKLIQAGCCIISSGTANATTNWTDTRASFQNMSGGTDSFLVNGAADGTPTDNTVSSSPISTLFTTIYGGRPMEGDIAAILIYSGVNSPTVDAQVEAYISGHYGTH